MKKTLSELIEIAWDIKIFFQVGSYELHHYEDGSFIDFRVKKITDLPTLRRLSQGLTLKFFAEDSLVIVRLFERDTVD